MPKSTLNQQTTSVRFTGFAVGRNNVAAAAGTAQTGSFPLGSLHRTSIFHGDSSSGTTPVCSVRPTIGLVQKPWASAQRLMVRELDRQPDSRLKQMPAELIRRGLQIVFPLMQPTRMPMGIDFFSTQRANPVQRLNGTSLIQRKPRPVSRKSSSANRRSLTDIGPD